MDYKSIKYFNSFRITSRKRWSKQTWRLYGYLRNTLKSHNTSIKDSNAQNTLHMKYHKNKELIPSLKCCTRIKINRLLLENWKKSLYATVNDATIEWTIHPWGNTHHSLWLHITFQGGLGYLETTWFKLARRVVDLEWSQVDNTTKLSCSY